MTGINYNKDGTFIVEPYSITCGRCGSHDIQMDFDGGAGKEETMMMITRTTCLCCLYSEEARETK